jgi:hypothetical protein
MRLMLSTTDADLTVLLLFSVAPLVCSVVKPGIPMSLGLAALDRLCKGRSLNKWNVVGEAKVSRQTELIDGSR